MVCSNNARARGEVFQSVAYSLFLKPVPSSPQVMTTVQLLFKVMKVLNEGDIGLVIDTVAITASPWS